MRFSYDITWDFLTKKTRKDIRDEDLQKYLSNNSKIIKQKKLKL